MNPRSISVVLLALNLALVGIIVYMVILLKGSPLPTRLLSQPKVKVVTNTVTQIAVRKLNATNLLAALANRSISWAAIESTNYYIYVANLRAIGCPEETIKDIIITDIAKLYARRRAELRSQGQPYEFWRTDESGSSGSSGAASPQFAALDKEQRALVKELLGSDLQAELKKYVLNDDQEERMYGFLPLEKRDKLKEIQSTYDELEQEIYARAKGLILDEDQEQIKRIEKQRMDELAKILTPQELEEYELRNSDTAQSMRSQLSGFDPTEEEFRKIFRLQKVFDTQFAHAFDATDEAQMEIRARAQEQAQDALNDEIKKVIGEKRFAEYERAQDADYKALVQLTDRFTMPREVATRVYDMKLEAERQKLQIETNPNLTEQQRQAALASVIRETERSVMKEMGNAGQTYLRSGGQWIRDLGEYVPNVTIENEAP